MTLKEKAKEKAKELVFKYSDNASKCNEGTEWDYDKECALICVNEVIDDRYLRGQINFTYWTEVKKEINKL